MHEILEHTAEGLGSFRRSRIRGRWRRWRVAQMLQLALEPSDASRELRESGVQCRIAVVGHNRLSAVGSLQTASNPHNLRIARPKILLVVAHPGIGAALETLLRIDERYDVRRVPSIADAQALAADWKADAALVDGVLLATGSNVRLNAPAVILSSNAEDGQTLARKVDDNRGWLRKDSTVEELVAAIDQIVGRRSLGPERGEPIVYAGLAVLSVALAALIGYLLWLVVLGG